MAGYGFNPITGKIDRIGDSGGGGGGGIITITGDSGSVTGSIVTLFANNVTNNSGQSVKFVNSGSVSTLNLTDANLNTMLGKSCGKLAQTYNNCVAVGYFAGLSMTTANSNVFVGLGAGKFTTTGSNNTYVGTSAGTATTTGQANTAVGSGALANYTTGTSTVGSNVSVGYNSLNLLGTGTNNTALGALAGSVHTLADSSNIDIRNTGVAGESNTTRLGTQGTGAGQQNRLFAAGITGVTVPNQQTVAINPSTGQLGVEAKTYFQAYRTSNQIIAGGSTTDTIIFDTAIANIGSGYNVATGVFTAPTTGFYGFSTTVFYNSLNTLSGVTSTILGYSGSVQSLRLLYQGISAAADLNAIILTANWAMPMTAGDTVKIQPFADGVGNYQIAGFPLSNSVFNTASTFSGFRIA